MTSDPPRAPTSTALAALRAALHRFTQPADDPLPLFVGLVDALRPAPIHDAQQARANYAAMLDALRQQPEWRAAVRAAVLQLLATRRHVRFFSDAGLLPNSGFFSELARRVLHRALPEVPDPLAMRDAVRLIYHHPHDHQWLAVVDADDARAFWELLDLRTAAEHPALRQALADLLDAAQVLSHRIGAMGLEPELLRVLPELDARASPFLAQSSEAHRLLDALRDWLQAGADPAAAPGLDERHLLVLLAQCNEVVRRARKVAAAQGTSLRLTYLLLRLREHLARLEALLALLAAGAHAPPGQAAAQWADLFQTAVRGESQRNSIRRHAARMTSLLALRVTENASQTGEHYVTSDRAGWLQMWRSAMGAGAIIALLALIKIDLSKLALAPLNQAFVYSLNYGLGFVLVQMLHFTIATKQPAMTASTIAAAVGEAGPKSDLGALADLVVDVLRTQLAAILGNVLVALPVAMLIAASLAALSGQPFIDAAKAEHLLHDLHPFASLAIPHAAVAGVCLFLAGLISGYFDNQASYTRVPERVARLPWLVRLAGAERARRIGLWLGDNLGGLAGNFLFGVMLGTIGTLGMLVGLPVDIRHIAFASANLGYAVVALEFALPWSAVAWAGLGVALVGLTNLAVSFSLALWVALRSRGVQFTRSGELLRLLAQRFRQAPARFFVPPRVQPVT